MCIKTVLYMWYTRDEKMHYTACCMMLKSQLNHWYKILKFIILKLSWNNKANELDTWLTKTASSLVNNKKLWQKMCKVLNVKKPLQTWYFRL